MSPSCSTRLRRRDAVHDLVVDRDAERGREDAVGDLVALERRHGALLARQLLGDAVELPVVMPGRTMRASARRAPRRRSTLAARMISISSGAFSRIMHSETPTRVRMRASTSSRAADPVDLDAAAPCSR